MTKDKITWFIVLSFFLFGFEAKAAENIRFSPQLIVTNNQTVFLDEKGNGAVYSVEDIRQESIIRTFIVIEDDKRYYGINNDNGLPAIVQNADYELTYSNYTSSTVDICVRDKESGIVTTYPNINIQGILDKSTPIYRKLASKSKAERHCNSPEKIQLAEHHAMLDKFIIIAQLAGCFAPEPTLITKAFCASGVMSAAVFLSSQIAEVLNAGFSAIKAVKIINTVRSCAAAPGDPVATIGCGEGILGMLEEKSKECGDYNCECWEKPVASMKLSPPRGGNVGENGLTLTMDASGSMVNDSGPAKYKWRVDGEIVATSETATHIFDKGGLYDIELTVTDANGFQNKDSYSVYTVIEATFSHSSVIENPLTISFDADDSFPDEGFGSTQYAWTVEGGPYKITYNDNFPKTLPTITFKDAVDYTVSLTVQYDDLTDTVQKLISLSNNSCQSIIHNGLEWQLDCWVSVQLYNEAMEYCDSLELTGHSDWRVPSKNELKSIVFCSNDVPTPLPDHTDKKGTLLGGLGDGTCCPTSERCFALDEFDIPTICPIFSMSTNNKFWTSEVAAPGLAWIVNFNNGSCLVIDPSYNITSTRCVRTSDKQYLTKPELVQGFQLE